jgi:hypothetical protein
VTAAPAAADRPIRVDGLAAKADRAGVDAALDSAFAAMAPCFRRAAGEIKVKVAVGADGEVTSAAAVGKGGAAQCAAGILAVTKFPAGAWKATVVIQPISVEAWLTAELGKQQTAIRACQSKDPKGAGDVVLQLAIGGGGGAVTSAAIEKSTAPKPIAECARTAAMAIRLGALPGGRDVKYRMQLAFAGGSGSGTTPTTTDGGGGGMVSGALSGETVRAQWQKQQTKTLACGAKGKPGTIEMGFKVRGDGSVKNVLVRKSTIDDKNVLACVEREIGALKFPTAGGETSVILPLSWK